MVAGKQHRGSRFARIRQRLRVTHISGGEQIARLALGESIPEGTGSAENRLDGRAVRSRIGFRDIGQRSAETSRGIQTNGRRLCCESRREGKKCGNQT